MVDRLDEYLMVRTGFRGRTQINRLDSAVPVAALSPLFRPRVSRPGASRGPAGEPGTRGRYTALVRCEIQVADEAVSACGSRVQRYIEMSPAI